MSKRTLVDFSDQSSINPVLQAALSSLDLNLDAELVRYRRRRPRQPNKPQARPKAQAVYPVQSFQDLKSATEFIALSHLSASEKQHQTSPSPKMNLGKSPSRKSGEKETQSLDLPNFGSSASDNGTFNHEEILSLIYHPESKSQQPPDDYLESSERLLQSLIDSEEESQPESMSEPEKPSLRSYLFTPLGLGSILVLLVASALLGSALINTQSIGNFRDFLTKKNNTTPTVTATPTVVTPPKPSLPNTPNLATQEFVPLNLETLSTLEVKPNSSGSGTIPSLVPPNPTSSIPNTQSNPVNPSVEGSSLANALLPPSLQPSGNSPYTVPLPSSGSLQFYVLANYENDSSLVKAKKIVKNAQLRDFGQGKRIQMGVFKDAADAEAFIAQLKKAGIETTVFPGQ